MESLGTVGYNCMWTYIYLKKYNLRKETGTRKVKCSKQEMQAYLRALVFFGFKGKEFQNKYSNIIQQTKYCRMPWYYQIYELMV